MTTSRTTLRTTPARGTNRNFRRAAVGVLAAAGVALTPLPASAHSTTPASSAPAQSYSAAPVRHAAPAPAHRAAPQKRAVAPAKTASAPASGAAATVVKTALAQVGDRYVWGASGPDAFDCSGLTQYAYAAAGISLPHSSRMQSRMGTPVSKSNLRPGDLVFFYSAPSHVGIYIGDGKVVHSPNPRVRVNVINMDYMPFHSARRLL